MKVIVLSSGSKGNVTYVETPQISFLIDIGMSTKYIEKSLLEHQKDLNKIKCVFITHTHIDHISGLKSFIKKYNPVVYLTLKMYEELKDILKEYVIIQNSHIIEDLEINVFKTSHDTSDSIGYVFNSNNKSIVYVTDTGYINTKNYNLMKNKDLYIFESNHDVKLLMDNDDYPYYLKQRILGDKGHLSNDDSSYYLSKLIGEKTKTIILAHLSEQNNDPIIAFETLKSKINREIDIIIAKQDEKTELIEI